MSYESALRQLAQWLSASQGKPIETGGKSRYLFALQKRFTLNELRQVETRHNFRLPAALSQFYTQVGSGLFFFSSPIQTSNVGIEIRRIDDTCEIISRNFGASKDALFSRYLPIGTNRNCSAGLVVDLSASPVLLSHVKTFPSQWLDLELDPGEAVPWEDWVESLVESAIGA